MQRRLQRQILLINNRSLIQKKAQQLGVSINSREMQTRVIIRIFKINIRPQFPPGLIQQNGAFLGIVNFRHQK
jgi:hypothetical protein